MTRHTSPTRWALALAILATAGGAIAAPSAWADAPLTLCVHQSSPCPAGATDEGSDLQGALDAAAGHPASPDSPNVIDIASGTYTTPAGASFTYNSTNPLRIVGAGSDSTTLTAADNVVNTLILGASATTNTISVSGLTITNLAPGAHALVLAGGSADHLVVATTQAQSVAVELRGGTLSQSAVHAENGFAGVDGPSSAGASIELDDDTIDGQTDAVTTSLPTTIRRVTLNSENGLFVQNAAVSIDDSLVEAQQGITALGYGSPASIDALNDTLIAMPGATQGVHASSYGGGGADVQVANSIVYAFPYSFETFDDAAIDHATIEAGTSNYNGMSSGSGITRTPPIGADPGFVAPLEGNYHLASYSDLVDASARQSLGPDSPTTDRDGNPRAVAVTNPATPVDLGAYEYQPPAAGAGNPGGGGNGGNPGGGNGGNPGGGGNGGNPGSGSPGMGTPGSSTPSHGALPTPPSHHALTVKLTPLGHITLAGRQVSLALACTGTGACSAITVTATTMRRHHRVAVGSLTSRLSAGHRATLTLRLNRTGRALLASAGRLAVTVTVTVRNGSRTQKVETAHLSLT